MHLFFTHPYTCTHDQSGSLATWQGCFALLIIMKYVIYLADVFNSAQAENVYSVHSSDCLSALSEHNFEPNICTVYKLLIFFRLIFVLPNNVN